MIHQLSLHLPNSFLYVSPDPHFLAPNYLTFPGSQAYGLAPALQQSNLNTLLQYQAFSFQNQLKHLQLLQQFPKLSMRNSLNKAPSPPIKQEQPCLTQQVSPFSQTLSEVNSRESLSDFPAKETSPQVSKDYKGTQLKSQISSMVSFFMREAGKPSQEHQISLQRAKYAYDSDLLAIFDSLNQRFASTSKCREDMIRFVLRKALSSMRNTIKEEHKLTAKAASLMFCQKYFKDKTEEMSQKNIAFEDEDDILNFLLPYKANSRHRTANNSFVTEIFASEAFYNDYKIYLGKFDEIMQQDNERKAAKLVDYLVTCAEEGAVHKVKNYKRLPWLDAWIKSAKVIAVELLTLSRWKNLKKKPRCE